MKSVQGHFYESLPCSSKEHPFSNLWISLHEDMMFESATAIHASTKDSLRTKAKPQRVAESKMERTVGT